MPASSKNTPAQPDIADERRTAKIFVSWIGNATMVTEARKNGAKIGRIIQFRAVTNGIPLREVAGTLKETGDFYQAMVEGIEKEIAEEKVDKMFGRKARKSDEEKKQRKTKEVVGSFMMVLLAAALDELEEY